jgi:hypothetical protein
MVAMILFPKKIIFKGIYGRKTISHIYGSTPQSGHLVRNQLFFLSTGTQKAKANYSSGC